VKCNYDGELHLGFESVMTARHGGRPWDYALALLLAFLVAAGSIMYMCYWSGHTEGIRVSNGILTDFEYTLDGLHTVISVFLVLSFVGLWLRRNWALFMSSLAFVSVLVIYGYWHCMTVKYLSELQAKLYRRVQQELGWFHGATKLDFVVLALVAILRLWHLLTVFKMTHETKRISAVC
jgi:hypothetical protein